MAWSRPDSESGQPAGAGAARRTNRDFRRFAERATLGEIGHRLGRKVLAEVATVARPDTILAWYRKLVARLRA
jgi:hypothetical protein